MGIEEGLLFFCLVFTTTPVMAGPVSREPIQCSQFYNRRLDRMSQVIKRIQNRKANDTTSLRQETKFVVPTVELMKRMRILDQVFGKALKNRDKTAEGKFNITSTLYLTVVKYLTSRGDEKSAKARFRKYFTRDANDPAWQHLEVSKDLKDRSWLELKIQHPEFPNVVNKPRLLCLDRDIRFFTSDHFFDHKEGLEARLKALNPGKDEEIKNTLDFFTEMFSNPYRHEERLFAKTEYERESYSIKIPSATDPQITIDVQLTLDQHVRLTRLADNTKFTPFEADETVVEVKIPVEYAKLTEADLKEFPGLAEIKELVEALTAKHNPKWPINKGKMSKIEKEGPDKDDHQDLDVLDDMG